MYRGTANKVVVVRLYWLCYWWYGVQSSLSACIARRAASDASSSTWSLGHTAVTARVGRALMLWMGDCMYVDGS
jgi:hypothetical protein